MTSKETLVILGSQSIEYTGMELNCSTYSLTVVFSVVILRVW